MLTKLHPKMKILNYGLFFQIKLAIFFQKSITYSKQNNASEQSQGSQKGHWMSKPIIQNQRFICVFKF